MDFSANKQDTYEKRIASLPDQPNMQPDELKAYFDSSPEQLRQAHNALCDALTEATSGTSAAASLGFQRTAGVPADNVQAAVENVQAQLDAAVMGNIPSGSVTQDKLAQDVRDRFTAIESTAAIESSTRSSSDSYLQNQINTHSMQIAGKCEIVLGTYTGDGSKERFINLGFTPKAIYSVPFGGRVSDNSRWYGGFAMQNYPVINTNGNRTVLQIETNGFRVFNDGDQMRVNSSNGDDCSNTPLTYYYIAFR